MAKYTQTILGFVLGALVTASVGMAVAGENSKPAYLVVGSRPVVGADMSAYRDAAVPLAQQAGLQILARDAVTPAQVLEGSWPYEGLLIVEQFDSMDAIMSFWHSDEYQAAKQLRAGKVELDFVVAISGQ